MRVSKKALRPFAVILVSLSMSALLTGCQTSSDSASQAVGGFGCRKHYPATDHRRLQFGDE